jgi:DNA-binding NarL/FixJ family response regulator
MGEPDVVRVAIVDDHPVARWGVESALRGHPGAQVVASTASVDEVASVDPDVVLLDLYLGGRGPSLGAVAKLTAAHRVLVISASGRRADIIAAVRAGADGYLSKRADAGAFLDAVATVCAGGFYLSSELADIVYADVAASGDDPSTPRLSPREEQVLHYIAAGFTHAQTATRLGIQTATVDTYVKRIRTKTGLGNKADLTRTAFELGQVEIDPLV